MIQGKKLFEPVRSLAPKEAQEFMESQREGDYTFLDVRQPGEYAQGHLPGARLIPLPELPEAYVSLERQKPVIAYCAVGGRSRVAAQLLLGKGFEEVYNLKGGIKAWEGLTVRGPKELNLDLIRGDETPREMLALAYHLEEGLVRVYEKGREEASHDLAALLDRLIRAEEAHRERVLAAWRRVGGGGIGEMPPPPTSLPEGTTEGGFSVKGFLHENASAFHDPRDLLQMALMIETQALDLYLRFADQCSSPEARSVLHGLAQEEKGHMKRLGKALDEHLATH